MDKHNITVSCPICGKQWVGKHNCQIELNDVEEAVATAVMRANFCDHFCCGMTPELCQTRNLIQALKDHGFIIVSKASGK